MYRGAEPGVSGLGAATKKPPSYTARGPGKCGDEETRTPDILLAKQALYQLSYVPKGLARNSFRVQMTLPIVPLETIVEMLSERR